MPDLIIPMTQDQYDRFSLALAKMQAIEGAPPNASDEQMAAQCKREAAAITYAAEVGRGDNPGWAF